MLIPKNSIIHSQERIIPRSIICCRIFYLRGIQAVGMARKNIRCDKEAKSVNFPEFESNDPLVYEFFESAKESDYEAHFNAILHIGTLALMEDRIGHLIESAEGKYTRN